MKQSILALVFQVEAVEKIKNGYKQVIILHQPAVEDDLGRVKYYEQYFPIIIWSKEETDSRFLKHEDVSTKKTAICYLKGDRWFNDRTSDYSYNIKLQLSKWDEND